MSTYKKIMEAMACPSWDKVGDGYEMHTKKGKARLFQKKKVWYLSIGGKFVDLGRRASFDRAEGILKDMKIL